MKSKRFGDHSKANIKFYINTITKQYLQALSLQTLILLAMKAGPSEFLFFFFNMTCTVLLLSHFSYIFLEGCIEKMILSYLELSRI